MDRCAVMTKVGQTTIATNKEEEDGVLPDDYSLSLPLRFSLPLPHFFVFESLLHPSFTCRNVVWV